MDVQMQMLNEIRELNQKLSAFLGLNKTQKDWLYIGEVEQMLNRKRTWIKGRTLPDGTDQTAVQNVNEWLFYGLDWKHEGKLLIFNRKSIERLKKTMQGEC